MSDMSNSIELLAAAMAKAQAVVRGAVKDSTNPHLKSNYADLASITDACRDAFAANGLAVVQVGTRAEDGKPWLRTVVMHSSGQWIAGMLPLVTGEPKGISLMQALGSAITYARRYGLAGAAGVVTEDDDGHGAGQRKDHEPHHSPAARTPATGAPANGTATPPVRIHPNDLQEIRALLVRLNVAEERAVLWASRNTTKVLAELTPEQGKYLWDGYKAKEQSAQGASA